MKSSPIVTLKAASTQAQLPEKPQAKLLSVRSDPSPQADRYVSSASYKVSFKDQAGRTVTPDTTREFEDRTTALDVVDLLAYSTKLETDGTKTIYVAAVDSFRPVTLTNRAINTRRTSQSAFMTSLPGAYVETAPGQSTASLAETAAHILRTKLKLETSSKPQILGGSHFPNPKYSPEMVTLLTVEVELPKDLTYTIPGTGHSTGRAVRFIPLQEVFDRYAAGKIKDTRLVDASLRLADRLNIDLNLSAPKAKQAEFQGLIPIYENASSALTYVRKRPVVEGREVFMEVAPDSTIPRTLESISGLVEIKDQQNEQTVPFQGVRVKDSFASHFLCYQQGPDGKIYVLVNKGYRPAIAARQQSPHPIGTEPNSWSIEALGFAANNLHHSNQPDNNTTRTNFIFRNGISSDSIKKLSSEEFPSPGFNALSVDRFLVATSHINEKILLREQGERGDLTEFAYIELNALLSLGNLGEIHDLNLLTSARYLQKALHYDREKMQLWQPQEREQLSEIATSGSTILNLFHASPETLRLHQLLSANSIYMQLLRLGENNLGVVPRSFAHHEEKIFFDAGFAIFAMPQTQQSAAFIIQLLHDLRHYAIGSMIPFLCDKNNTILRDKNNNPVVKTRAEYEAAYRENEAEAGFFSHYDLPKLLGLKDCEVVLGFKPLCNVFDQLDIVNREQALQAFRTIELKRRIPEEILNHPNYQNHETGVRDALLQLLKLSRIFDCHMEQLYPHWTAHPKVSQVALNFSNTIVTSLDDHLNAFNTSMRETLTSPEGFNPFKTKIAQFINSEVRIRAMRLAYISELLEEQAARATESSTNPTPQHVLDMIDSLDQQIEHLHSTYTKLRRAHSNSTSLDYTPENLIALRLMNEFQTKRATQLDTLYTNALDLLDNPQLKEQLQGRELPFFPRLEFGKDPAIMEYALACEAASKLI